MTDEEKDIVSKLASGLTSYRSSAKEIYDKYGASGDNPYDIFLQNTFGVSPNLELKEIARIQIANLKSKDRPNTIY